MCRKPAITGFAGNKINNKNIIKCNKTIDKQSNICYDVYVNKREKNPQKIYTHFIIIYPELFMSIKNSLNILQNFETVSLNSFESSTKMDKLTLRNFIKSTYCVR